MQEKKSNVVLIGMAGAGKSTIGVLAAKALGMDFLDTDLLIQQQTGKLLQETIDEDGIDAFLAGPHDRLLRRGHGALHAETSDRIEIIQIKR